MTAGRTNWRFVTLLIISPSWYPTRDERRYRNPPSVSHVRVKKTRGEVGRAMLEGKRATTMIETRYISITLFTKTTEAQTTGRKVIRIIGSSWPLCWLYHYYNTVILLWFQYKESIQVKIEQLEPEKSKEEGSEKVSLMRVTWLLVVPSSSHSELDH